jgi:hypothetical protein
VLQPEGEKGIPYDGTARGGKGDSVRWYSQREKRGFCTMVQPEDEKEILYDGAARGKRGFCTVVQPKGTVILYGGAARGKRGFCTVVQLEGKEDSVRWCS